MFHRPDRGDELPDDRVLAARDEAAQAFLALDDEQRAVAETVRVAVELSGRTRLGDEWLAVAAIADAATSAYLASRQERPLERGRPTRGALDADVTALREIERAREAIRRFRAAHDRALGEAGYASRNLPRIAQEARTALGAARTVVQNATASGVRSRRAEQRLAEAERSAAGMDGPGAGLQERMRAARHTLELARSAAALAAETHRTARQVRSALAGVTGRRSEAESKAGRIAPSLSALRREFSEACSRDLTGAEAAARAAIADAERAHAEAGGLADAGDWDEAADQVAAAGSALARAEERHDAVVHRLAALRDVRADPARHAAAARSVLRDAQRLVVDRGLAREFGPLLDAQAVRLENAQHRLAGVHPDHWLYLTELRGVRERVREVVAQARRTAR